MEFSFLKPASITPTGWLKKQLRLQADGQCGNLDKIWPDVYDSKWLGGTHEGWERLPYFLDGFIPMAYLLNDKDKILRAKTMINALLSTQAEDGCFYPRGEEGKNGDIWSLFLISKVLTVYADCSGEEERILPILKRFLRFIHTYINSMPPYQWGASRWFECIIAIRWVYDRCHEEWLLSFARRLAGSGFHYRNFIPYWKEPTAGWAYDRHVVNLAMALKSEAVYADLFGEKPQGLAEEMLDTLSEYHGTAYGHFTGDECLASNNPSNGSELCGVVEAMYSYEWLAAVTGDAKWGDCLEALAFNALPATISDDMWTHQYDQCVNQVACVCYDKPIFTTNSCASTLFGLEPNYGCCTANFGQGFPKFALSAYLEKGDSLVVLSPVPSEIDFHGGKVTVSSEYPFRLHFTIHATEETKILLRIPSWAALQLDVPHTVNDGYASFTVAGGETVSVRYLTEPRFVSRPEGRTALHYGALLFAIPIPYEAEMHEFEREGMQFKFPYCDYFFRPTGPWEFAYTDAPMTVVACDYDIPFSRTNPAIRIRTKLRPIQWGFDPDHPMFPAKNPTRTPTGDAVAYDLQPYGATYLRIAETVKVDEN